MGLKTMTSDLQYQCSTLHILGYQTNWELVMYWVWFLKEFPSCRPVHMSQWESMNFCIHFDFRTLLYYSPTGWSKLTSLYPTGASKQVDSMTHLAAIPTAEEPGSSSCSTGVSLSLSISWISALIACTPATGDSPPPILPNVTLAFRTWNSGISMKIINHGVKAETFKSLPFYSFTSFYLQNLWHSQSYIAAPERTSFRKVCYFKAHAVFPKLEVLKELSTGDPPDQQAVRTPFNHNMVRKMYFSQSWKLNFHNNWCYWGKSPQDKTSK